MPARLQLVARTGHPDFLDLPWSEPLAHWDSDRLVEVQRGIHRHVVRFVQYAGHHADADRTVWHVDAAFTANDPVLRLLRPALAPGATIASEVAAARSGIGVAR